MNNLLSNIPLPSAGEFLETLVSSKDVRIERIVSRGHTSPPSGWYDQDHDEFVALLSGAARIDFDDGSVAELTPGDWLQIPAHRRHRVAWTDENEDTVWLAVHY